MLSWYIKWFLIIIMVSCMTLSWKIERNAWRCGRILYQKLPLRLNKLLPLSRTSVFFEKWVALDHRKGIVFYLCESAYTSLFRSRPTTWQVWKAVGRKIPAIMTGNVSQLYKYRILHPLNAQTQANSTPKVRIRMDLHMDSTPRYVTRLINDRSVWIGFDRSYPGR